MRRTIITIISFFVIAFTFYLLFVPIIHNPIYNLVKPTVENRYYLVVDSRCTDIILQNEYYANATILTVQPLNFGLNADGGEEQIYIPNSNLIINDVKKDDIIVVAWIYKINGRNRILSVISYDSFMKLNSNKVFIK